MGEVVERSGFDIVGGPERNEIFAALEFSNSKYVHVELNFDVDSSYPGSGQKQCLLVLSEVKPTCIQCETQYPNEKWLHINGRCVVDFTPYREDRGKHICNFLAFYLPDEHRGTITFEQIT